MGVDEENRGSCLIHDYACWRKVVRLSMKHRLISRYHPSSGEGRGVKKTYPCLGVNILMKIQ
jgi:hypothetical protein